MAASPKTTASSESAPRGNRENRRREISGILLLAGGLFAVISLLSMQVGGDPATRSWVPAAPPSPRGSTASSASAPIW